MQRYTHARAYATISNLFPGRGFSPWLLYKSPRFNSSHFCSANCVPFQSVIGGGLLTGRDSVLRWFALSAE